MAWTISIKGMIGNIMNVTIGNPQEATVLDLKSKVQEKDGSLPPYLQRLIHKTSGGATTKLEDKCKLVSYSCLRDGATLFLVRLNPCELYVQDTQARLHALTIPSSELESYSIAQLRVLFEDQTGQSLGEYEFQFQGRAVEETRHGRQLTLKDYGIKARDQLFILKIGFRLDITNPQVDICFMVDCTGSMSSWFEAVKNTVKQLRDRLDSDYRGCDLRFAFVRYTDYDQPASSRTTWIDFTKSQSSFHNFLSPIIAHGGGGDGPEDVMGGLKVVFTNLSWQQSASKVLIHIGDYPCHGKMYHNLSGDAHPNGDPAGILHEDIMKQVVQNEVQYWFGYIQKSYTDKMISVFNECLRRLSEQRMMIRQFDAVQPSEVGEAVHRSVTASVFASEAKKVAFRKYTLDSTIPNWSSCSILEQYGKKTPAPGQPTLRHLQEGMKHELPSVPFSFKCAPNPFTEGEESAVFHAYDMNSKRHVVLKQFRREGREHNCLDGYMKVMEAQYVAAAYAQAFNTDKNTPEEVLPIDFVPADIVECRGGTYYIYEPFLEGRFEKFNNNRGVVSSKTSYSQQLQTFSHYTWEKSGKSLLVCDLQGVSGGGKIMLTDPAIHSRGGPRLYGDTDLGNGGIEVFFKTHICNDACARIGLKPFST